MNTENFLIFWIFAFSLIGIGLYGIRLNTRLGDDWGVVLSVCVSLVGCIIVLLGTFGIDIGQS